MKNNLRKSVKLLAGLALILPLSSVAQDNRDVREKKGEQEVIVIRKGDKSEKVVVEVDGDKVTVNGKPLDEYKGGDVTVRRNRVRDGYAFNFDSFGGNGMNFYTTEDSNRAMLGVTTDKADDGVEIQSVNKESGAAKAGLKEGDVIKKLGDKKIEDPDDLTAAVKAHKPGDKVEIVFERDGKEQKATAELTRWKNQAYSVFSPNFRMPEVNLAQVMPRGLTTTPRSRDAMGQFWTYSDANPRLGLSVQDTDDGKGVKVIEVDDESNADKAGIREDDVITDVEGKAVNSADEVARIIKESKEKRSVMVKLNRGGKTMNIEVRMPRKLKTADL